MTMIAYGLHCLHCFETKFMLICINTGIKKRLFAIIYPSRNPFTFTHRHKDHRQCHCQPASLFVCLFVCLLAATGCRFHTEPYVIASVIAIQSTADAQRKIESDAFNQLIYVYLQKLNLDGRLPPRICFLPSLSLRVCLRIFVCVFCFDLNLLHEK